MTDENGSAVFEVRADPVFGTWTPAETMRSIRTLFTEAGGHQQVDDRRNAGKQRIARRSALSPFTPRAGRLRLPRDRADETDCLPWSLTQPRVCGRRSDSIPAFFFGAIEGKIRAFHEIVYRVAGLELACAEAAGEAHHPLIRWHSQLRKPATQIFRTLYGFRESCPSMQQLTKFTDGGSDRGGRRRRDHHRDDKIIRYAQGRTWRDYAQGRICMRTRIPKLIAEINTIIADHSNNDLAEEQEAIALLKRARHALGLARVKLQEADLKKNRVASDH